MERYDGDGKEDAPGSPVILNYRLIHEMHPPSLTREQRFVSPEEFARLFEATYEAMKEASPEIRLWLPGADAKVDYAFNGKEIYDRRQQRTVTVSEDGFLVQVLRLLDRQYLDIGLDYHYWTFEFNGTGYLGHKEWIERLRRVSSKLGYPALEIMSGEMGTPAWTEADEKDQAVYVVKSYVLSLSLEQKMIFWTSLVEYLESRWIGAGVHFGFTGLVNNPENDGDSSKKLGYYTYKKMVEALEGSNWDSIQTIQEKDGVYIYKFTKNGKPIWVAWNDSSAERQISISGINSTQVKVTVAVPKYSSGKEVTDYTPLFRWICFRLSTAPYRCGWQTSRCLWR